MKDAKAFWTAHKIATTLPGPLIGFLASVAVTRGLHRRGDVMQATIISILCFLAAVVLTFLVSLVKAPKLIDDERQFVIHSKDVQVAEQTATIERLSESLAKPERTAAEQHHYDLAKSALEKHGPEAKEMLRHLRIHGKIIEHWASAAMYPPGMTRDRALEILKRLKDDQIVMHTPIPIQGGNFQYDWEIAPGMVTALDALLYNESNS